MLTNSWQLSLVAFSHAHQRQCEKAFTCTCVINIWSVKPFETVTVIKGYTIKIDVTWLDLHMKIYFLDRNRNFILLTQLFFVTHTPLKLSRQHTASAEKVVCVDKSNSKVLYE